MSNTVKSLSKKLQAG